MNNLAQRILTGAAYVTLMLFAASAANYITILLAIVAIIGLFELKSIFNNLNIDFNLKATTLIGVITYLSFSYPVLKSLVFIGLFLFFVSLLYKPKQNPIHLLGSLFISLFYIFIPLAITPFVAQSNGVYEAKTLMGLFILIWSSDSWAYVSGRLLGKRKLFERLSPKKTWEGFWGSVILTSATGYLLHQLGFGLTAVEWIVLGAITVVIATLGDLFQSMLKRAAQIKDSGNILPGHGGILDRFDSILFCMPAYYIYFYHIYPLLNF